MPTLLQGNPRHCPHLTRPSKEGLESFKGPVQGHLSVSGRRRLNSGGRDVLTLTVLDDTGLLPSRLWGRHEEAFRIHGQGKWPQMYAQGHEATWVQLGCEDGRAVLSAALGR